MVDHVPPVSVIVPLFSDTVPTFAAVFMASLKVISILPLGSTAVAPFAGVMVLIVGAVLSMVPSKSLTVPLLLVTLTVMVMGVLAKSV